MPDQGIQIPKRATFAISIPPTPAQFEASIAALPSNPTLGPRNFTYNTGTKSCIGTSPDYFLYVAAMPAYATASITKSVDTSGTHYFLEITNTVFQVNLSGTGAGLSSLQNFEAKVRLWFNTHPKEQQLAKTAICSAVGFYVASIPQLIAMVPTNLVIGPLNVNPQPLVAPLLAGAGAWLATHITMTTSLPFIGAKLM